MELFWTEKLRTCEQDIVDVEHISHLLELDIAGVDAVLLANPDLFANAHNLRTLVISHGNVSTNNVCTIVNFITGSTLSKLELLWCTIENDALASIINAVAVSTIETLNFNHIFFNKETAKAIINVLEQPTLVKLSFIECTFCHEAFIVIMSAIKKSTLKTLMLEESIFNDKVVASIADCIEGSKLTKLSLRDNSFYEDEHEHHHTVLRAIKRSLVKTLNVQDVPFYSNFIIINDLISGCGITKLKFDHGELNDEERLQLVDVIQKNHLSEHISFCFVEFTDQLLAKTCCLLGNANNARVKSLEFDHCSFPDAALDKIIGSIKKSSIVSIKFREQDPSSKIINAIKDLLENCYFDKLELDFFGSTNKIVKEILPSMMQSSITKFTIGKYAWVDASLREKIDNALQVRRHQMRNNVNMKSARILY